MFKSYGEFWKKYAKFSGRTDRKTFWLTMLINTLINVPLMIFAFADNSSSARMIPFLLFFYATILPFFAICRRRLRDAGFEGKALWWILLPYVGWVILIVKFCKPSIAEEPIPEGAEIPILVTTEKSEVIAGEHTEDTVTVMSSSGYHVAGQERSYSSNIFGILGSFLLIFGGLSGRFVLRGTDSSGALVVAGFVFLVLDIIKLVNTKKEFQKAEEEEARNLSIEHRALSEAAANSEQLQQQVTVHLIYDDRVPALDYGARLNGKAMTKASSSDTRTSVTTSRHNVLNLACFSLTAVFDIDDAAGSDVYIRLFISDAGKYGIALPSCVSLIKE